MISDIRGDGWSSLLGDAVVGIRIGATNGSNSTTGGIKLYNNSVNLGSGSFAGNASGTQSAALFLSSVTSDLDIRNNVFATNLLNSAASSAKSWAIYSAAANTAFAIVLPAPDWRLAGVADCRAWAWCGLAPRSGAKADEYGAFAHRLAALALARLVAWLGLGVTRDGATAQSFGACAWHCWRDAFANARIAWLAAHCVIRCF